MVLISTLFNFLLSNNTFLNSWRFRYFDLYDSVMPFVLIVSFIFLCFPLLYNCNTYLIIQYILLFHHFYLFYLPLIQFYIRINQDYFFYILIFFIFHIFNFKNNTISINIPNFHIFFSK